MARDVDASSGITLTGTSGLLKIGGRKVADLGRWTLTRDPGGFTCSAPASKIDEYWVNYGGPYELHLYVGTQTWRWKDVDIMGREPMTIHGKGKPERY